MSEHSEFLRGPKWRTRTTPSKRHRAAAVTFLVIVAAGWALLLSAVWLLDRFGAPGWLTLMPWWLPTIGAVIWALAGSTPAFVSDDDDDSWSAYAIRWVLVGENEPRPTSLRVVAAIVFGAPTIWAILLSLIGALTGLF
jgi:hypothetical protein